MKRYNLIFILVAIVLLFSCNNNTNTPSKTESTQKSYVPIFKTQNNSRGLINMQPEGNPFNTMKDACNIMTSLPLMVGIIEEEGSFDTLTQNISKQNGIGDLGFDIRLNNEKSKQLEDGSSFLLYEVCEDNKQVGFIEYVYNPKTKSFSYRQSVMLTICANMGSGDDVPIIISPYTVEYTDIPLNIDNSNISYVIGEYKDNSFIDNGIADFIMLQYANYAALEFQRKILSSKFDKGIYYSVYRPSSSYHKNIPTDGYLGNINNILSATTNNTVISLPIKNIDQAKAMNIETLNSFIKYTYSTGNKIISHDYKSYEDFNSASIVNDNLNNININKEVRVDHNPVCYNSLNKKTASAKVMDPSHGPYFKDVFDKYSSNGFMDFGYNILVNTNEEKEFFIKTHLMNCGIPEVAITEEFLNNYSISLY